MGLFDPIKYRPKGKRDCKDCPHCDKQEWSCNAYPQRSNLWSFPFRDTNCELHPKNAKEDTDVQTR